MTKTQRLIELMMRVYDKPTFTVDEMAAEFGVSYRTMLRYLHELSGMGVPLYAEPGRRGGYSLLQSANRTAGITGQRIVSSDPFQRIIRPQTYVIGLEFQAPFTAVYMAKVMIPKLWVELGRRQHEIPRQIRTGVKTGVSLSRTRLYHYIAGVEVSHFHDVPEGMVGIILPTREYAVYTHQGDPDRAEIDQTHLLLMDKLRQRGLEPDLLAYALEIRESGDSSSMNMHIPLCDSNPSDGSPEFVYRPQ
ncbi:HTH domain-containing protein [Paenibacillus xylanilyticus]|uniref:HTH domain-containing protein n=1 Tax=Paenibacillus xylanilyticus TaxID=248903 RepID=A0A7Y6BZW7_9BACL|nr:HTH domain-containing protein [Paenibacillus xylanilyticus]NUU77240.1 HTH domain-containing protein [Paenibacillus xylanilyticus]